MCHRVLDDQQHEDDTMEVSIEKNLDGAARSLGLTLYRRDYGTHAFNEIELNAWRWSLLVSLPAKSTTSA
jgi:hypothetical protein